MYKTLFFLLVMTTTLSAQTKMTSTEINSFKEKVKVTASKTKTIISDFTQYKHMNFLSDDIKTSGKILFKSPNLVKWAYTNPFQYSVIFKGDKLLINDEGKKSDVKIGSSQLFKKLNQLIVNSISGTMFNDDEFIMTFTKTTKSYQVQFSSKDATLKKYIKQFVLNFDKSSYAVFEVKMIEPSDDYTKIVFKNRKENQVIKNEVFNN